MISILKKADAGTAVTEICRDCGKYGIFEPTYYNWRWQNLIGQFRRQFSGFHS